MPAISATMNPKKPFPKCKTEEELIAELELSMEHGGDMEKEVFGGLIQKLKQELAEE